MAQTHQSNIQNHQVTGWAGWVAFAGFLMAFSGIFHIILGIGGVLGQDWYLYASGSSYIFDASAWGWSMIVGGALLALSGSLLLAGNMFGRIMGVLLATGSLLVNIALFPAAPVWSLILILVDLAVIYAIIAHGSELKHLDQQ
jgi:hypothetical protein